MRSLERMFVVLLLFLLIIGIQKYILPPQNQLTPTPPPAGPDSIGAGGPTPFPKPTGTVQGITTSKCHSDGILPDPTCTPGAIDPAVTQDNINSTICVKGYTTTVRPPVSYTNALEKQQILEYGYADTDPRNYEEDHLISLELGGSTKDPKNLWPEPGNIPNPKDKIENLCRQKVCSGQIPLAQAQAQIATNWPTACQ